MELFQENEEKSTDEGSEVVGDANLQVTECPSLGSKFFSFRCFFVFEREALLSLSLSLSFIHCSYSTAYFPAPFTLR